MSDFTYGDILRYPDDQGVGDEILFMFIAVTEHAGMEYQNVVVLRTTPDDDQWESGNVILAGIEELIPYKEPAFVTGLRDVKGSFSGVLSVVPAAGPATVFLDGKKIGTAVIEPDGSFTLDD